MANPASLTINELTANASINQPAAQAIDTNGTVPIQAQSQTDRLFLEVVNSAAAALTVTLKEGDHAAAQRTGGLAVAVAATGSAGDKKLIGPFEAAKHVMSDGDVDVQFQAASGSPNATVRVYRLPRNI